MSSAVVVVLLPVGDHDPGLGQGPEDVDVEAFVADPAVERLDVAVAPGLAGWDERQPDPFAGPVGHRLAGEFGAVVAAQHGRVATRRGEAVEFVDEDVGGDGAVDEAAEAFAGVFVDDGDDLDRAAVGGGVELEVDGPDLVRGISLRPVGAVEVPRRLRRRRCGTRRPSSRQSRWIFLWLTAQPSPRAS